MLHGKGCWSTNGNARCHWRNSLPSARRDILLVFPVLPWILLPAPGTARGTRLQGFSPDDGSVLRYLIPPARRAARCLTAFAAAAVLAAACGAGGEQLSYDSNGVARGVLGLVARNTEWARSIEEDAVLYRIELRPESPSDRAPSYVLYNFYSPRANVFMTATSDPRVPWEGAEPQDWPVDQIQPMPLPAVAMDFRDAWERAKAAGLTNVTSASLEVQRRFGLALVVWSLIGTLPQAGEGGVYFNALSKERIYRAALISPPESPLMIEKAMFEYRRALRGPQTGKSPCRGPGIPIPAQKPVVCFNVESRDYSAPDQ